MVIVSDGAGSASQGGEGAAALCTMMARGVHDLLAGGAGVESVDRSQVSAWLDVFGMSVDVMAAPLSLTRRDYGCTLLGAVVASDQSAFFQVGDGAMVMRTVGSPELYRLPILPDRGEYVNATFFATDPDASDRLVVEHVEGQVEEVAAFSDGVEEIAVRRTDGTAHHPFFRSLFRPVRRVPPSPRSHREVSGRLSAFLSSPRVNAKTGDDKTIVLASRAVRGLLSS